MSTLLSQNCICFSYREPSDMLNPYSIRARILLKENLTQVQAQAQSQAQTQAESSSKGNLKCKQQTMKKSNSASKLSLIRIQKEQYQKKVERSFNELIAEQRERLTKTNNSIERIEKVFYTKHPKVITIKSNNILLPELKQRQNTPEPEKKKKPTLFTFVSEKPVKSEFVPRNVKSFKDMVMNSNKRDNNSIMMTKEKNKKYKITRDKNSIGIGMGIGIGSRNIDLDSSLYDNLFQANTKMTKYGMVNLNMLRHVPGLQKRSNSNSMNMSIINTSSESTMLDQSQNFQIRAIRDYYMRKRIAKGD